MKTIDRDRILVPTDPDWDPSSRDSMVEDLSIAAAVEVLQWALHDFPPQHVAAPAVVGALWTLGKATQDGYMAPGAMRLLMWLRMIDLQDRERWYDLLSRPAINEIPA